MIRIKSSLSLLQFLIIVTGVLSCSTTDNGKEGIISEPIITPIPETTTLDIAYGAHPQQKYDLYLPANHNTITTKTMILIHGGGWKSGDKSDMNNFVTLLQKNHPELAVINLNYVLSTETIPAFPNQLKDIVNAIQHIKEHADEYKISSEFGFIGTSAGAHLGMLYGYNKTFNASIKMICNIVGPTDFTDPNYLEAEDVLIKTLLKDLTGQEETPPTTFLENLSPVFLIDSTAPPTLSFYGNKDPLVPNSQHIILDNILKKANVPHTLTVYDGGHATWKPFSYFDLNTQLNMFIIKHMK